MFVCGCALGCFFYCIARGCGLRLLVFWRWFLFGLIAWVWFFGGLCFPLAWWANLSFVFEIFAMGVYLL